MDLITGRRILEYAGKGKTVEIANYPKEIAQAIKEFLAKLTDGELVSV